MSDRGWSIDHEPAKSAWRRELVRIYDEAQARKFGRGDEPDGGTRVPRKPKPNAPVTPTEVAP